MGRKYISTIKTIDNKFHLVIKDGNKVIDSVFMDSSLEQTFDSHEDAMKYYESIPVLKLYTSDVWAIQG